MDITAINRNFEPLVVAAAVAPVEQTAETRDLVQAVKALNATEMFGQDNQLVFQMDRQARRMVIRVINSKTKEVLTQVPPDYISRLSEDLFQTSYDAYLESRVLSATPLELVHLLYRGAIGAVQDAQHYLAGGKIVEISRAFSKACAILIELSATLDHETGGELAGRLAALFDYMQGRLLEANLQPSNPPLRGGAEPACHSRRRMGQDRPTRRAAHFPCQSVDPASSLGARHCAHSARSWSM
jgi:flagellar protein FliS